MIAKNSSKLRLLKNSTRSLTNSQSLAIVNNHTHYRLHTSDKNTAHYNTAPPTLISIYTIWHACALVCHAEPAYDTGRDH